VFDLLRSRGTQVEVGFIIVEGELALLRGGKTDIHIMSSVHKFVSVTKEIRFISYDLQVTKMGGFLAPMDPIIITLR
jgi:hypothetical protein